METVIIVIHLMVVVALVTVVLLQKSEGGALGIGGGGGGGGFMTGRGTANVLTRATTFLAAAFFITSITLTLLARGGGVGPSIFDNTPLGSGAPATSDTGQGTGGTVLDQLREMQSDQPSAPQSQ